LGTVDRFCLSVLLSATYKIDHLPKQQVVPSDDPQPGLRAAIRWWSLILSFDYIRNGLFAIRSHPSDLKRVRNTTRATTICTLRHILRVGRSEKRFWQREARSGLSRHHR
jgi:hypothetical protein